jgi:hypothetical protein
MALYGAPIWADKLKENTKALLRGPQRVIAQRMARCFRTVAFAAACALAGILPWALDARLITGTERKKAAMRSSELHVYHKTANELSRRDIIYILRVTEKKGLEVIL